MRVTSQWEYACLLVSDVLKDDRWDKEITFFGPEGSTGPFQESSAIPILNKLGKDGWEAFHVERVNVYPVQRNYWLKRPAS